MRPALGRLEIVAPNAANPKVIQLVKTLKRASKTTEAPSSVFFQLLEFATNREQAASHSGSLQHVVISVHASGPLRLPSPARPSTDRGR